jgi:peptidoglycan/LPS O-acetylase OafA/YrhL
MKSPLTFEAFHLRTRMPVLDGVRAFAVFGVVLHHLGVASFDRLHGYRGVWVFFVLSGFLITTLAMREEKRAGSLNIRAFAIRRIFRIVPLFYIALAAYLVWACIFQMDDQADLLKRYLYSYVLYYPEFPIFRYRFILPFSQAWSLGIEEKFYLVWPVLAFWALAHSRYRIAVSVGLLATTFALTTQDGYLAQMWGSYTDILIGCLLGLLVHDRRSYNCLRMLGRSDIAILILVLVAAATLNPLTRTQPGERLFSLLAAAAMIALTTNSGVLARVVAGRWLVSLGAWSYAIYLIHPIAIDSLSKILPEGKLQHLLLLPLTLGVVLPFAWLLHVHVEKPCIELGRRAAARISKPVRVSSGVELPASGP